MELFFVIPVHNEEQTVAPLTEGILKAVGSHSHTVLFVDDGSTDGTRAELDQLARQYPSVEVLHFRRNFGKSLALAAGFARAHGDVAIMMDGDLQDDPKEIPKLLAKLEEGYDVVCGWKARRHDPWHKTLPSRVYNRIVSRLFKLHLHDINTGFKVMRMEVAKRLALYGERHRLITVFAVRQGYSVTEVPVEHHPRRFGKSHYGIERFSRGALDTLTVWFLERYQHSPGHYFGRIGVGLGALGILAVLTAFLVGWFSTSMGLGLWLTGLILFLTGGLFVSVGLVAELIVLRLPRPDTDQLIVMPDPPARQETPADPEKAAF